MSRIKHSLKNLLFSVVGEILLIVFSFITRTVFIKTLGVQFLGINGLFSNIISMLSLAEFGIGSAIIYNLYKPIAQEDKRKILLLMKLYKTAYRFIALLITLLGVCVMPFLSYLIKDDTSFINLYLIFIIYLLQSVSTYIFFAYKNSIIKANQKEYIISGIGSIFTILTNIAQIIVLIYFKDFTLYIFIVVLFNVLKNFVISIISNKMYPFIKEETDEKLDATELKGILKNCYALFIYKINTVVLNATDNTIISIFIGLNIVGIYSNYLLLTKAIKGILVMFYNAISASQGNLHAVSNQEHEKLILRVLNLITAWMFGVAAIGLFTIANNFIRVWIGESYALAQGFVLLLAIDIYIYGLNKLSSSLRHSMGLFQQAKYRPLAGMIINIAVSLLLVRQLGIYGVLIGTIVANCTTYIWYDPYIIHKYGLGISVTSYFLKNIEYCGMVFVVGFLSYYLSSILPFNGWHLIITQAMLCITIPSVVFFIAYRKTDEFKYVCQSIKKVMRSDLHN